MANEEHAALLLKSVSEWNKWRRKAGGIAWVSVGGAAGPSSGKVVPLLETSIPVSVRRVTWTTIIGASTIS